MHIHGRVENGVIVLDAGSPQLPEGTPVSVVPRETPAASSEHRENRPRLEFPLIRGEEPSGAPLSNAMIESIFEEDDLEKLKRSGFDVRP